MRDKRRHCEAVNSTSLRAVFWRGNLMQVIQSSKRDCFVPRQLRPCVALITYIHVGIAMTNDDN